MKNIKYSIIIPHYNIPELLTRCLKSIPKRQDIQIIVIDDNSINCDKYIDNIPELSRKEVEFYITRDKLGAGHARNVGLKYIKGQKTIFADADDFFTEDFNNILDEYYNYDEDIIYFNVLGVYSNNINKKANRNKNTLFSEYKKNKNLDIFRYKYTEPWGKIFKTSFIIDNKLKFDETPVANDYMFSVQTGFHAKKILAIDRPLYIVTLREDSLSYKSIDTIDKLQTRIEVTARVQVYLKAQNLKFKPMLVMGLMVNLMHRDFILFIKDLFLLKKIGISITTLLQEIFSHRILSPKNRKRISINNSEYLTNEA